MAEDKKKAEKEKAKKKKKRQQEIERIAYPWDDHGFPSLEQRISAPNIAEAQMDPKQLASMRAAQQKKVKAAMGTDPAELKRRWTIQVSIAGIENNTNDDWEAFCAFSQADGREDRSKKNRLHNRFKFTKSYAVPAGSTRRFKKLEQVENKKWDGSYIGLKRQEIIIDLWLSSATNFNQLLGTARKTLYDIANDEVVQNFFVKPTDSAAAYNIGRIQVDAVVSEVFQFTIMASNWQFLPRPEFARLAMNTTAEKKIRIAMPTGPDEPSDTFETSTIKGPVYCWQKAGQFVYEGTKVGLGMEAMTISLYSGGSLQGKAVVSLGVVGVYPIAIGVVKAVSPNAENFVQGKVGGSLSMMTKSLLLDDNVHDEDPSIPRPHQPDTSLVVYHLSPKMQYLIVDVFACDGLPVADPDYGSSNAFVRVKFDNMVQQSAVVYASLSPTWNHRFYMPVRVTDEHAQDKSSVLPAAAPSRDGVQGLPGDPDMALRRRAHGVLGRVQARPEQDPLRQVGQESGVRDGDQADCSGRAGRAPGRRHRGWSGPWAQQETQYPRVRGQAREADRVATAVAAASLREFRHLLHPRFPTGFQVPGAASSARRGSLPGVLRQVGQRLG
ncbi:unnamed protein product [Prorocentrum cordatum]|uniref:C2 domain-containing protein n=1 Tax=Prorocentrum cordatum TaxID=2364126 RepID=A0ABN9QUS8_9DINO|nr:unnamed protein product [Polarella glacialis]